MSGTERGKAPLNDARTTARQDDQGRRVGPDGNPLDEAGKGRAGETRWSQSGIDGQDTPAPKQQNERDESATSQAPDTSSMGKVGKIAHHDAKTQVDTDRGPVLDAVYNGPVSEGRSEDTGKPPERKPS